MATEGKTIVPVHDLSSGTHQCVLCCENINIFAIGICDHPVCFRCSARMRVLADQRYCAVCRTTLDQVVFTKTLASFKDFTLKGMSGNRQFGIRFFHKDCSVQFSNLLEAVCPLCTNKQSFRAFADLRTHVRKEHNRQYICVDHLHIFPSEFEVYTRQDLVKHRKSGDVAKSVSFRGHPLCVFCDERYFDNDELLSHLRKNHFWCHFCEKDGKQEYYCNYNELQDHFREGHFLCEEDKCRHEKFTSVFRSKIDLQAHKLAAHSNKLTKAAAKQARQLDIDIDYGSRRKSKRGAASVPDASDVSGVQAGASDDVPRRIGNQSTADAPPLSDLAVAAAAAASEARHNISVVPNPLSQESSQNQKENALLKQHTVPPTKSAPTKAVPATNDSNGKTGPPTFASKIVNGSPKNLPRTKPTTAGNWSNVGQPPRLVNESNFPSLSSTYPAAPKPSRAPPGFADTVKRAEPPGLGGAGARPKTVSNQKDPRLIPQSASDSTERVVKAPARPPGLAGAVSVEETFQARNQRLIQTISGLMSSDDFRKFRVLSGQYRKDEVSGSHYYNEIKILLGENHNSVFSELVDLLPDEKKQSELLTLHKDNKLISRTLSPTKNGKKSKERKSKTPAPEASNLGFDSDFPALPPTQQKKKFNSCIVRSSPASNVWSKRK